MKNIYSKAILLLLPVMLTGCDFINKATLHTVSFDEYREKALKVDTNHPYTSCRVTGYTKSIDEVDELYNYDAENKIWVPDESNTTQSKAQNFFRDVKSDAKQIDVEYKSIVDKVTFKVGMSGGFEYTYNSKELEFKYQFNDKYGMITFYYSNSDSSVRHLEFKYSK